MRTHFVTACCILALAGCTSPSNQTHSPTLDSYYEALEIVQAAQETIGGSGYLDTLGSLYLVGSGTYDLSTRMQGMQPNTTEPYAITEKLAINTKAGNVAFEYDTHVNPDAREWIRYIYDGQNRMLFLERHAGFAFWESRTGLNQQSKRYSNMIPHLLLEEALSNKSSLRFLGTDGEGSKLVSFVSSSYGHLTLFIHPHQHILLGVEYLKDMPLLGDTSIKWRFKEYITIDNLGAYPSGYTIKLNGKLLKEITYSTIEAGIANTPLFAFPDSIDIPEKPELPAGEELEAAATEEPVREPTTLAENVYVIPHIRPGFHPMVIEFDRYLMVIDAPAGWFEIQQLPAMQWAEGVSSSSVGRMLRRAIRTHISEKPVRYVALTHFHSDHAGGIRPFIAEGATILATSVTAPLIEQAAKNSFTLSPDELTGRNISPLVEIVDRERTISDGEMAVRLIDVGENPHAAGMLVAYLPNQRILYQSDLFEPIPMRVFPSKSRLPVMKWFVNWLDHSGLDVERIYAIHGSLRVTDEHLDAIREME